MLLQLTSIVLAEHAPSAPFTAQRNFAAASTLLGCAHGAGRRMLTDFRIWGHEYLVIRPQRWQREHATHFWLQGYEVLDLWQATHALERIARHDKAFLRELARDLLPTFYRYRTPLDGSAAARQSQRMLEELGQLLGSQFSKRGEPPGFAWFYICQRKRPALHAEPAGQRPNHEVEAARRAPRGFVVVEVVNTAGAPVPLLRIEVLLADGELLTRATDAHGQLQLDSIPQGRCHIRVPTLDGNAWQPAEGAPSARIDSGHAQVHRVKSGENLTRIAARYGINGWQKLWEASANRSLRKRRKNPNLLYPGDEVTIPGIDVHEIVRPTDQTHRIVVSAALVEFRVVVQDHNQLPYANEPYELRTADDSRGTPRTGSTDCKGKIAEQVLASTPRVEVYLPGPKLRWVFELNTLLPIPDEESLLDPSDPATPELAIKAMQARLLALGFPCGAVDGRVGPRTRAALALWQEDHNSTRTGPQTAAAETDIDHATLVLLATMHEVVS